MESEGNDSLLRTGLRAQDIQTSVQDVDLGHLNAETKNIRLVGMAERLAIHIRGIDVIHDIKKLEYVSSQFGIDALVLPKVLSVLQELEWVRVNESRGSINSVEESVPYFTDLYSIAGEFLEESDPTEVERATIEVVNRLSISPYTDGEIKAVSGIDDKAFQMVLDMGKSGRFIDEYQSKRLDEKVLYSPLYWVENPEKLEQVFELLKQFGADRVVSALSQVRSYQGLPLPEDFAQTDSAAFTEDMKVIAESVRRGIILAPEVISGKGGRNFAFTPQTGISPHEKPILEKAMAVLSCIRYGEHFGTITKIRFPEAILNSLISSPHKIGAHTEIRKQYAILVARGMGKVFPHSDMKDRYFFELLPTEENIRAVKLARDLLQVGELIHEKGFSPDAQKILFNHGSYEEAARTLPKMRRPAQLSMETQNEFLDTINDTMDKLRGAW